MLCKPTRFRCRLIAVIDYKPDCLERARDGRALRGPDDAGHAARDKDGRARLRHAEAKETCGRKPHVAFMYGVASNGGASSDVDTRIKIT